MKLTYLGVGFILLLLVACSGKEAVQTKESMIEELQLFEDSLKNNQLDTVKNITVKYAEKCLTIYRLFPKSEEAPTYLDKAHVIYSSAGLHSLAVLYADTLIRKYPAYKNRPMVLQSLANAYDLFLVPRKKELVQKYYSLLLKENPKLPAEERESIQYRLDHINLTFEELIEEQAKNVSN